MPYIIFSMKLLRYHHLVKLFTYGHVDNIIPMSVPLITSNDLIDLGISFKDVSVYAFDDNGNMAIAKLLYAAIN